MSATTINIRCEESLKDSLWDFARELDPFARNLSHAIRLALREFVERRQAVPESIALCDDVLHAHPHTRVRAYPSSQQILNDKNAGVKRTRASSGPPTIREGSVQLGQAQEWNQPQARPVSIRRVDVLAPSQAPTRRQLKVMPEAVRKLFSSSEGSERHEAPKPTTVLETGGWDGKGRPVPRRAKRPTKPRAPRMPRTQAGARFMLEYKRLEGAIDWVFRIKRAPSNQLLDRVEEMLEELGEDVCTAGLQRWAAFRGVDPAIRRTKCFSLWDLISTPKDTANHGTSRMVERFSGMTGLNDYSDWVAEGTDIDARVEAQSGIVAGSGQVSGSGQSEKYRSRKVLLVELAVLQFDLIGASGKYAEAMQVFVDKTEKELMDIEGRPDNPRLELRCLKEERAKISAAPIFCRPPKLRARAEKHLELIDAAIEIVSRETLEVSNHV